MNLFVKIYFVCVCEYLHVGRYMHAVCAIAVCTSGSQKRASDPLELKIRGVMSWHVGSRNQNPGPLPE